MPSKSLVVALFMMPVVAFGSIAEADWFLFPLGGTYTWDGLTGDPLVGTNIGVKSVFGNGTPAHNGSTLQIQNGLLDFKSGGYNGAPGSWSWGAGAPGTLNVTGCIAGLTATTCTGSNNVILLGDDFQSVSIVALGSSNFDVVFGQLQGSFNPLVASYFGLSTPFTASSVNALFTTSTPGKALYGTNLGGAIKAVPPLYVSEDWGLSSTLGFFALALATFGVACRLALLRSVVL